jgi:carbamoyltransferase
VTAKSRYVLGISALYHDSAAALLRDGEPVACASEERFSRVRHDAALPTRAARWCLAEAGITTRDLECVVYYEKPLRKFERLLVSQVLSFPRSLRAFRRSTQAWLTDKLWVKTAIVQALGVRPDRVLFSEHHLSHAASAFYASACTEAAVLTADGVGEWATTALYRGGPSGLVSLGEVRFPHSLGLLYSAFTAWLGFHVNDGEYKVMGMAAYGEPRFEAEVREVITLLPDGGFAIDPRYVAWQHSATDSYSPAFEALFGPARFPGSPFDPATPEGRRYADVAASVQKVVEDAMVALAVALHARTGLPDLCLAGGVALNGVANHAILTRSPFERLHVQPAAGDAGGALGAAWWAWHEVLGGARCRPLVSGALGQAYDDDAIAAILGDLKVPFERLAPGDRVRRAVDDLAAGRVIGWFQGRFEWGPRALGQRSILADPRVADMRDRINTKVKFREPFRPFAPAVPAAHAADYFDLPPGSEQPTAWMLMVVPVNAVGRALFPATTHVDGSARVHVVRQDADPGFHTLLEAFGARTGHPVLLNTSFNLKGEPIVASPVQALATFFRSGLDALYLGDIRVEPRSAPATS